MVTTDSILAVLKTIVDPDSGQDVLSTGTVGHLEAVDGDVALEIVLAYPARSAISGLRRALVAAIRQIPGVGNVSVALRSEIPSHSVRGGVAPVPGVRNVILVASGKGGVGKSTTAVNLALALAAEGARVGVLDADIHGPSQPLMTGIDARPESEDGTRMEPLENFGLQVMSMGFLVDADEAMVWRGPMATQALGQLLHQTNWRDLDYLLVDMPPGTGDIHLTLCQGTSIAGAVIVTTPQEIALQDTLKGIRMFEKVGVPILGIVENMAVHICTECGHAEHVFGADGGKRMAKERGLRYLGALPLDIRIREQADAGTPTVVMDPDGDLAGIYKRLARQVGIAVAALQTGGQAKFPAIIISPET